jgi:parallel beta-helix repeat protein
MNKKQNILFLLFTLLISSFYLSYSLLLPVVLDNPVVSKLNLPSSSTQVAALEGAGSGLVGWWKFDDGSDYSRTGEDSAGNNSGTLANGATWTADSKIGGGAIKFDGTSSYVQYTGTMGNVQTISYWIKANSLDETVADLGNGLYVRGNGFLSGLGTFNSTTYVDGVKESLGPELVTNGDMESGSPPTGWTYSHGCAGTTTDEERTGGVGQHSIDITSTDQTWVSPITGPNLVPGKVYRATGWIKATPNSNSAIGVVFADSAYKAISYSSYTGTNWQKSTQNFGAAGSGSTFKYLTLHGPVTMSGRFDDISIKEITSTISPGQWHHVVIVIDAPINVTNMTLGKSGDKYLNGTLDDIRVYNRALSASEIQDLRNYNPGNATAPTTPNNQTSSTVSDQNSASTSVTQTAPVAPTNTGNYYIDSTAGSDANNAASPDFAWKTLSRANSFNFKPGDHILFKRGGLWRGQLNITSSGTANSPIIYDSYGTGAAPTISGADVITGWTQYSGNIYVANVGNITAPTQLYVDGQFYDAAHYPNSGYLLATANSTDKTSIIDSNLTISADQIVGATVLSRPVHWFISSKIATAYDPSSHTITLDSNIYGNSTVMLAKFGYYLQGKLGMLDSAGEWFYDSAAGKLYLWTPNNDNPANHTIELSARQYGIQSAGKNYVTIQNLNIVNANQYDVSVYGSNVTLNNLSVQGGSSGIYSPSLTNSLVQNNSVKNTLSTGIKQTNLNNVTISNNNVNNAGNVGVSPKESEAGIASWGTAFNVTGNTVTNSGYIGIEYGGDQTIIQNNTIDRTCLVIDDCGGIYTANAGKVGWTSIIRGNTIKNIIGNNIGTSNPISSPTGAVGVYLDDLSHGYTVVNNTVDNAEYGIYIHSGYDNTVTGNIVHNARSHGFLIVESSYSPSVPGTVHDNTITGNIFESIGTIADARYTSDVETVLNFGTYNNNQYCHPNSNFMVANSGKNYNFVDWQKFSGQDLNSTDSKSTCGNTLPAPISVASNAISGSCGASLNSCAVGTFSDLTDTANSYLWTCIGSGGGSTASCSQPIAVQGASTQNNQTNSVQNTTPVTTVSSSNNAVTAATPAASITQTSSKSQIYPNTSVSTAKLDTSVKSNISVTKYVPTKPKTSTFKPITNLDNSLLTIPTTTIDITVPKVPSWIEVLVALFKEIVNRIKMGAGKTVTEIKGLF